MKFKFAVMAAVALITVGAAGAASAHPSRHHDEWRGSHYYNTTAPAFEWTEEQRSTFDALRKHHWSSVEPLTQQLIVKQAELQSQMIAQVPDADRITVLNREIGELNGKLAAEHIRFRSELEKQGFPGALAGCDRDYHRNGPFNWHGGHKRHMGGGWDCRGW